MTPSNNRIGTALALSALLLTAPGALAQSSGSDQDITLLLDELRAPSSPAFTLLGITPSDIARPSSPKELAATLANGFGSDGLALEFLPAEIFGSQEPIQFSPSSSALDLLKPDPLWEEFTISIAKASIEDLGGMGQSGDRYGFGFRVPIYRQTPLNPALQRAATVLDGHLTWAQALATIKDEASEIHDKLTRLGENDLDDIQRGWLDHPSASMDSVELSQVVGAAREQLERKTEDWKQTQELLSAKLGVGLTLADIAEEVSPEYAAELREFQHQLSRVTFLGESLRFAIENRDFDLSTGAFSSAEWKKALLDLKQSASRLLAQDDIAVDALNAYGIRSMVSSFSQANKTRSGWSADLAAAATVNDFTSTGDEDGFEKAAAWLTLEYRGKDEESQQPDDHSFVFLSRYNADNLRGDDTVNAVDLGARWIYDQEDYSISLEAISRLSDDVRDTYRVAAAVEYNVFENYDLQFSFGRDYEASFPEGDELFVFAGISVGLGQQASSKTLRP